LTEPKEIASQIVDLDHPSQQPPWPKVDFDQVLSGHAANAAQRFREIIFRGTKPDAGALAGI
jgi:hypothetical protein